MVGDHPQIVEALLDLVADEPHLRVVGAAGSEHDVRVLLGSTDPDLLIVDADATRMDVVQVVTDARTHTRRCRLVALSSRDDTYAVHRILTAGFHRHVSKEFGDADLVRILLEEHVKLA